MDPHRKLLTPKDLGPQLPLFIGQEIKGTVTFVNNARSFAVQPICNEADLKIIHDVCSTLPDDCPELESVVIGTLWGALYSDDGLWYRALIQSVNMDEMQATVYFIDYGNSDVVAIEGGLRWLTKGLTKFPPQLLECQWLRAGIMDAQEATDRIDALMDLPDITITVVETKSFASEMNTTIGGEQGTVVVNIKELMEQDQAKVFTGPTLPTVTEVDSAPATEESAASSEETTMETMPEVECSGVEATGKPAGQPAEVNIDALIQEAETSPAPVMSEPINSFRESLLGGMPLGAGADARAQANDNPDLTMLKVLSLEAKINNFARTNQQISEELSSYYTFTTNLVAKVSDVKSELAQLSISTRAEPEQNGLNKADMDQLKSEIAANGAEINQLRSDIAANGAEMNQFKTYMSAFGPQLAEIKANLAGTKAEIATTKSTFEEKFREFKLESTAQLEGMKADFEKAVADLKRQAEVDQIDSIPTPPIGTSTLDAPSSATDNELKFRRYELELQAAKSKAQYLTECLEQQVLLLERNRAELAEEREKYKEGLAIKEAENKILRNRILELTSGAPAPPS